MFSGKDMYKVMDQLQKMIANIYDIIIFSDGGNI